MYAPIWGKRLFLGLVICLLSAAATQGVIGPDNVLVLYNSSSADGVTLADYYAQVHPGVHLLGISLPDINGVPPGEEVSADYYLQNIRQPILDSGLLTSSIDTIVTTKGLPLRIDDSVTYPTNGVYTDPFGVSRTVRSGWWRTDSSLESELTRIDTIGAGYNPSIPSSLNTALYQMGDQSWKATEGLYLSPPCPQPTKNPYFGSSSSFNYSDTYITGYGGMRLTSRLDGYTTTDVINAINKAQQAYLLPIPNSTYIVADNDPNAEQSNQVMVQNLQQNVLAPGQTPYVTGICDNTTTAITTAPGPVIGYDSHGVHATGVNQNYVLNLNFTLANGAVFNTHESFNAYTFNGQPGNNPMGQGSVADWLAIGGTAGVGNVAEPQSGSQNQANENQMFSMLLAGKTWGEAAWSSIQQLSYVTTVVGDPLMTWKQVMPGDANEDGIVDIKDLSLLGAHWGYSNPSMAGGALWSYGDFNGDGKIDIQDLSMLGANWGKISTWASGGDAGAGQPFDMDAFLAGVPEPSAMVSAIVGLLALLVGYGFKRIQHYVQH